MPGEARGEEHPRSASSAEPVSASAPQREGSVTLSILCDVADKAVKEELPDVATDAPDLLDSVSDVVSSHHRGSEARPEAVQMPADAEPSAPLAQPHGSPANPAENLEIDLGSPMVTDSTLPTPMDEAADRIPPAMAAAPTAVEEPAADEEEALAAADVPGAEHDPVWKPSCCFPTRLSTNLRSHQLGCRGSVSHPQNARVCGLRDGSSSLPRAGMTVGEP